MQINSSLKTTSHSFSLFFVRPMTEHKTNNTGLKCAFQNDIFNSFAVSAVIPLGQVTSRVSSVRWSADLNVTNTTAALEPSGTQTQIIITINTETWYKAAGFPHMLDFPPDA